MSTSTSFSSEELSRYARHLAIPEFGLEGQKKLKTSSVLVIGSGGLGSPLLLYLAAAGVGKIGIVDFDTVDSTNLQRQILFNVNDIGQLKAQLAKEKILQLNPHIQVEVYPTAFSRENALELVAQYDVVADGTDNFPTRYLVNDACVIVGKPNVYASIFRFEGQVSVFNHLNEDGTRGPNYRDLFPTPPPPGLVPNCAEGGVLGVLPGIIGSMQANEVIKILSGVGEPLSGRLFLFDAATFSTRVLKIAAHSKVVVTALIDYEQFCNPAAHQKEAPIKEITVQELQALQAKQTPYQIIDVREPYEYEIANLGGELIPKDQIMDAIERIAKDKKVIVHCRSGKRSADVIRELESTHAFDNLYNLTGGILAWAEEIDASLAKY